MAYTFNKDNNTLLFDLPVAKNPALEMGFIPKAETHVTIIGYTAGRIISEHIKNCDRLKELFYRIVDQYVYSRESEETGYDFMFPTDDQLHIIQKEYSSEETRTSLIRFIAFDDTQGVFQIQMEALFPGIEEHLSKLHVTLGVDGDHPGIGLSRYTWYDGLVNKFTVGWPSSYENKQRS